MHELGYTKDVLRLVIDAAEANRAQSVRKVFVTVGEVRDVVDELFRECFRHFARGTVAQDADLQIERVPLSVRCDDCGTTYGLPVRSNAPVACPQCGTTHYHLDTGMEFYVSRVEIV